MTILRPGSFFWFLAHDLRQSLRGLEAQFRGMSRPKIVAIFVMAVVALHLLAWPAALWIDGLAKGPAGAARLETWFGAGVGASLSLIIAQTLTGAMRILYARGDFELLFASPVSRLVVLASRALAIAFEGAVTGAMLLLPLADMGALLGEPRWLAIYPALLSSALAGAGVGLVLAMLFFAAFGPRRARAISQVAATLVGASFALSAQVLSLLPARMRDQIMQTLTHPAQGSFFDHRGAIWLPVHAALGQPKALVAWFLFALSLFLLAVVLCSERIAAATALATGASLSARRERGERAFQSRLGAALRKKERKLIWRDPWLLSQILLQIIYTLPVSIVLWRLGGPTGTAAVAFAPSIVIIASQLSGTLAWVALSAEDAPDFLATAPVSRREIEWRKIQAIAMPVGALLATPILGLALASPWGAACAAIFAAGAGVSNALVNLWRQTPGRRGMALRRHAQSKLVGLIEHLVTILWTVACAAAIVGTWIALAPLALAAVVLWLSRPRIGPAERPGAGELAISAPGE